MNSTRSKRWAALLSLLLGMGIASVSHAQYVWLNEQGVKQFSDMPPPASVPKNRILKSPAGSRPAQSSEPADAAAPASDAAKPKAPLTAAEQNADFARRKKEQAEKEKKAADEQQAAADKAKNCERARDYLRTLESGQRITQTDKNGERSFLNDSQRAAELSEARRQLENCNS